VVVTEGTRTEPAYLRSVRRLFQCTSVTVLGKGEDPEALVRLAGSLRDDRSVRCKHRIAAYQVFDEAWAVFDVEQRPSRMPVIRRALAVAARSDVKVAVSNPCFEYWLLLHVSAHSAAIASCREAQMPLRRRLSAYDKSSPPEPTVKTIGKAATRALAIRKRHVENAGDGNPSTNCDQLVAALAGAADPEAQAGLPTIEAYDSSLLRLMCGL